MKRWIRILSGNLILVWLAQAPVHIMADELMLQEDEKRADLIENKIMETPPESLQEENAQQDYFKMFTGKIVEIRDFDGQGSEEAEIQSVLIENEQGDVVNFLVDDNTCLLTGTDIRVGAKMTGVYDGMAPALMIYPPQYQAIAIAVDLPAGQNIAADLFDEQLISSDHLLKLNINSDTEVISQNGEKFEGELTNRKLIVLYGPSTRSIPAQTSPEKIIVLFEKAVHPIYELSDEESTAFEIAHQDVSTMDMIVNGVKIMAPTAYQKGDEFVMTPLRAVAEGLGYTVRWDGERKRIVLDESVTLEIGQDVYTRMDATSVTLGIAPEIQGETAYVPLQFFTKVVQVDEAKVWDGKIIIGAPVNEKD